MSLFLLGASGNLTSLFHNVAAALETIGGEIMVAVIGFIALRYVGSERHGAAVGILIAAVIPALFFLDPSGALNILKSTANSL